MSSESKKQVSIEDLLHLKRTERPPESFWSQFEQDLRAKQLAAIVEKRRWWAPYTRVLSAISRHQLPIAAAFVFGASAFVYYEYRVSSAVQTQTATAGSDDMAAAAQSATETAVAPEVRSAPSPSEVAVSRSLSPAAGSEEATGVAGDAADSPSSGRFLLLGLTARRDTPSARSIAANLAAAQASEPEIMRNLLGFSTVVDAQLVPERAPVTDPLARMTSPSDARRSRLLAEAFPAAAYAPGESAAPSADRLVRKLDSGRLYDSVSRYDVGGRQFAVSIRF